MLDTTRTQVGRGECVRLILVPRADFVILEAHRRAAVGRKRRQTLEVDVAVDLCITSRDVQRAPLAQPEVQTQSRREVAPGPAVIGRAQVHVPRERREVAALRVGRGRHDVAIAAATLVVELGVECQRAATTDVNGDRRQQCEDLP